MVPSHLTYQHNVDALCLPNKMVLSLDPSYVTWKKKLHSVKNLIQRKPDWLLDLSLYLMSFGLKHHTPEGMNMNVSTVCWGDVMTEPFQITVHLRYVSSNSLCQSFPPQEAEITAVSYFCLSESINLSQPKLSSQGRFTTYMLPCSKKTNLCLVHHWFDADFSQWWLNISNIYKSQLAAFIVKLENSIKVTTICSWFWKRPRTQFCFLPAVSNGIRRALPGRSHQQLTVELQLMTIFIINYSQI